MKIGFFAALAVSSIFSLAGCGGGGSNSPITNVPVPLVTPVVPANIVVNIQSSSDHTVSQMNTDGSGTLLSNLQLAALSKQLRNQNPPQPIIFTIVVKGAMVGTVTESTKVATNYQTVHFVGTKDVTYTFNLEGTGLDQNVVVRDAAGAEVYFESTTNVSVESAYLSAFNDVCVNVYDKTSYDTVAEETFIVYR